ncbi:MAG: hypothetical protein WCO56_09430 [Verrucomicrobiota bacterium]
MNRSLGVLLLVFGIVGSFAVDPSLAGKDRLNIELLKTLDAKGSYIRLEGRSLFITSNVAPKAQRAGFWFDIEPDPAAPVLLNKSLPGAWDVAVVGNYAFLCDYTKFLTVFDLRDHQWQQVAKLEMPSMTENITIRGKLAYVANHIAGLTIVDIADPAKPTMVSNFNPHIDCDGLALWKNYAVLYAHWESRLVLVDITDPTQPRQVGVYQHDKKTFNQGEVTVDGGFAYCTANNGLVLVNITDPANPTLARTVEIKGGITDVAVNDGFAFLAAKTNGVRVLNVSNPVNPVEVGRYTGCQASELAVLRIPQPDQNTSARARYYVYVAGGPASLLLFHAPVQATVVK